MLEISKIENPLKLNLISFRDFKLWFSIFGKILKRILPAYKIKQKCGPDSIFLVFAF